MEFEIKIPIWRVVAVISAGVLGYIVGLIVYR